MRTTREERRLICIEAISEAASISYRRAALAFDAQYGIVRVCSVEADPILEELVIMAYEEHGDLASVYHAMAAAGDLTNPPEKKKP